MKTCKTCNRKLVNYYGKLYLHPPSPCSEKDGWKLQVVDKFLAEKFKEVYGVPEQSLEESYEIILDSSGILAEEINRMLNVKGVKFCLKISRVIKWVKKKYLKSSEEIQVKDSQVKK